MAAPLFQCVWVIVIHCCIHRIIAGLTRVLRIQCEVTQSSKCVSDGVIPLHLFQFPDGGFDILTSSFGRLCPLGLVTYILLEDLIYVKSVRF